MRSLAARWPEKIAGVRKRTCVAAAVFVSLMVLFQTRVVSLLDLYPSKLQPVSLSVTAIPRKGASAVTPSVTALIEADGKLISPAACRLGNYWTFELPAYGRSFDSTSGFMCRSPVPSPMFWSGFVRRELCLHFLRGPECGRAEVRVNDRDYSLDLYQTARSDDSCFRPERALLLRFPVKWSVSWALISWLSFLGLTLLAGLGTSLLLLALSHARLPAGTAVGDRRWSFLPYFFVVSACFAVYWLAYYPALMTNDSMDHWAQATTLRFNDAHPVYYAFTLSLLLRLWHSPAILALASILLVSAAAAAGFAYLESRGARRPLLLMAALAIGMFPANALMTITIWKDIPFSALLMILTIAIAAMVQSGGRWLGNRGNAGFLFTVLLGIILYRHNGIAIAALLALIAPFVKSGRRALLAVVALSLVVSMSARAVFYKVAKVPALDSKAAYFLPGELVWAIDHYEGSTPGDLSFLSRYFTIPAVQDNFMRVHAVSCWHYMKDNTFGPSGAEFLKFFARDVASHPETALKQYADSTALLWSICQYPGTCTINADRRVVPNQFGLAQHSKCPSLKELIDRIAEFMERPDWSWLFWRPALLLDLSILAVAGLVIKRGDLRYFLLLLPLFANWLSLGLTMPGPFCRYTWSAFLIAPFLLLLCLTEAPEGGQLRDASPAQDEPQAEAKSQAEARSPECSSS